MILYGMDYKKTTFIGYRHFSSGLYHAAAVLNQGCKGSIDTYETRNMGPVLFTTYILQNKI